MNDCFTMFIGLWLIIIVGINGVEPLSLSFFKLPHALAT
jgi:hypothetical protein